MMLLLYRTVIQIFGVAKELKKLERVSRLLFRSLIVRTHSDM
jgi:hypothetical protein